MSRCCIGIDLGTSNCALAYMRGEEGQKATRIFSIPQFESAQAVTEADTLPSFFYYPHEGECVVGRMARQAAASEAARVIHSAKSWLCHGAVDRKAKILPWRSEQIADADKLSSVEASSRYLSYLKDQWDAAHPALPFVEQEVVVTVPASFDSVAQKLTLEAAELAGYRLENLRLLEEPQAAFYHWLQLHKDGVELDTLLPELRTRPHTVLVCDVGGGTSDFSLFEVEWENEADGVPAIRRMAVSEHLLLGGDNIDLALALAAERKLMPEGERLPTGEWSQLVSQCRDLKEKVFSGSTHEVHQVSVSGSGSGLFASVKSTEIRNDEVEALVLEGFFPDCARDAKAKKGQSGFREFGLPYAADTGVTRHLAEFLDGREVDAVLYNGGSLASARLREHLNQMIGRWQNGREPVLLENSDLDLAVAHGAARFGWFHHQQIERIESGAGHAIYLEVAAGKKTELERPLLCVLPHGSRIEEPVRITQLDLRVRVNQAVRFVPFSSARRLDDQAGDLVERNVVDFHPLPALETVVQIPAGQPKPANDLLDVVLDVRLNALGLLAIQCLRKDQPEQPGWQLDFNLRLAGEAPTAGEEEEVDAGIDPKLQRQAVDWIRGFYGKKGKPRDPKAKVRRLISDVERIVRLPKKEWSTGLSRSLWDPLADGLTRRNRSPDHEAAWLNLAGYCLRPGYGVPLDEFRINALWRLHALGLAHAKDARIKTQSWIFWRRVAGGLDQLQQEALIKPWRNQLEQNIEHPAELVRLAGSLERLPLPQRRVLAEVFTKRLLKTKDAKAEPYAWALGRLLSRIPLYGGPESVLPADAVMDCFAKLEKLEWSSHLATAFTQAARLTGDRHHDLAPEEVARVLAKLQASGAREERLRPLQDVVPMEEADRARLFGEALPVGLMLK